VTGFVSVELAAPPDDREQFETMLDLLIAGLRSSTGSGAGAAGQ
jgi:hypothetical protein